MTRLSHRPLRHPSTCGLTLLELLLSMALLSVVMIIIASAIATMQNTWMRVREKSDEYRGARMALDSMTRNLRQATLDARWVPVTEESDTPTSGIEPAYKRVSNLHFVCGPSNTLLEDGTTVGHAVFFQGPFGEQARDRNSGAESLPKHEQLTDTLSSWGFFVEYATDTFERPDFLRQSQVRVPPRRRFRLMEFRQPSDELKLFELDTSKVPPQPKMDFYSSRSELYQWFRTPLSSGDTRKRKVSVLAENVLACIITPFDPSKGESDQFKIARDSVYDTRLAQYQQEAVGPDSTLHRLPPALRLTVVMTSEDSWRRLSDAETDSTASQLRTAVNARFKDPERFEQDLDALEAELNRIKMRYRIFTTNIRMSEQ